MNPVEPRVRKLTEAEVEHFEQKGWVFLSGYLDSETTTGLHERAMDHLGVRGRADAPPGHELSSPMLHTRRVALADDAFWKVASHPQAARNLERLTRSAGVRYHDDVVATKLPQAWGSHSSASPFHQDFRALALDRARSLTCWIALDTVMHEMGSLQFLEGSELDDHLLGIAEWPMTYETIEAVLAAFPWLRERTKLSPPLTYLPGDATIHNSRIVHGTGPNSSKAPRWSFATSYIPADSLFTGAEGQLSKGLDLEVGSSFDHPAFPLLPH